MFGLLSAMPVAMSGLNCYMEYHSGINYRTIDWSYFVVYIHILKAFIIETGIYFFLGGGGYNEIRQHYSTSCCS
jgi:hypothetical protein